MVIGRALGPWQVFSSAGNSHRIFGLFMQCSKGVK